MRSTRFPWLLFCIALMMLSSIDLVRPTDGSRILVTAPYGTKSYHNMYVPIVMELIQRGHHVTVITNYENKQLAQTVNVRQIVIDQLQVDLSAYPNAFEALLNPLVMLRALNIAVRSMFSTPPKITQVMYDDQRIQDLIANDRFDLIFVSILSNAASYPLAWHFQAPMILLTPNAVFPGLMASLGDDERPSYVPFFMTSFTDRMNLFQRILNTLVTDSYSYFIHQWYHTTSQSIIQQRGLPDCPSLYELEKNIALAFVNTHPAVNYPRTYPPLIVEVGGMNCRPARPLPPDLDRFVSSHEDGFILFAVGSMLPMEMMSDQLIRAFALTFASLPQRVIWQWKGRPLENLPANVMALPWLPQQDLLGHPNCKLFMTHGGLNSMQEAIYHGVPVLGLPFGTDQRLNMRRAVDTGYARQLTWTNVSQESLTEAILDLLHNTSYSETVLKRRDIFRDQMETPLERAVYWTEYVLRHNGTRHLQLSSRHLTWYQRNLIDVYLVLILSALIPLLLVTLVVKKCCSRHSPIIHPMTDKKKDKKKEKKEK